LIECRITPAVGTHRWSCCVGNPVTNYNKAANEKKQNADPEWSKA